MPVVLGFRPSPHHLKTGVAEFGFWQGRGFFFFFWHKGIRINTWIKNYAQHPLVWKESNLRLAPLPLDVPRAGQLLTPKGGCVPAPSGSLCSAASTEHTVRTSARPSVTRAAGSSARGPPPYNIISNHQLTFKYFLKLR